MIIGTCSICGGPVEVPDVWGGLIPPIPTCKTCGAQAADHGPMIIMRPPSTTAWFDSARARKEVPNETI